VRGLTHPASDGKISAHFLVFVFHSYSLLVVVGSSVLTALASRLAWHLKHLAHQWMALSKAASAG
jgi:Ca2+/Na+ antiporter